ncbi:hypothetical protein LEN26_000381 [Aphanomyces euteiches]|nr:hypothetical protein AeMF1_016035 [Aphanomyces euteiches]KAH9163642.1 hypothetical protein LEN26_000381 [Aphanomyces euteiches]KAH9195803.1 hypothetical protein AeNC1_002225 [Aphanomyces euteiches]
MMDLRDEPTLDSAHSIDVVERELREKTEKQERTLVRKKRWASLSYFVGAGERQPFNVPRIDRMTRRAKRNLFYFAWIYALFAMPLMCAVVAFEAPAWIAWCLASSFVHAVLRNTYEVDMEYHGLPDALPM